MIVPPFTVWPVVCLLAQNICIWNILELCCVEKIRCAVLHRLCEWNLIQNFHTLCHRLQLLMNEITFRKHSKLHRCYYFEPLFYPAVMMFEEVHIPLILWGTNRIYIAFISYLTEMLMTTCFALQVKRHSFLPLVCNKQRSLSSTEVRIWRPSYLIQKRVFRGF